MESKDVAWIDTNHNKLGMKSISDRHLLNILRFVEKGRGWASFLTDEKIQNLFNEASKRDIKHEFSVDLAVKNVNTKREIEESDNFLEDDDILMGWEH